MSDISAVRAGNWSFLAHEIDLPEICGDQQDSSDRWYVDEDRGRSQL
ncbi:MAG: hypothetical protein ACK2T3_08115 [Candidatus Promineifilaceae bacterium]